MAEAAAIIAGGHTVTDDEPKYGLSVTGIIHPERILTKAGARPGDRIFLTKPLGTGVVTTALKRNQAEPEHIAAAVEAMLTLNRAASLVVREHDGVHACTDVTGFGLLGHASEIAAKSGVGLRLTAGAVPLLPGALGYAAAGHLAGGLGRNRSYFSGTDGGVRVESGVDPDLEALLYDPQTSGGLLLTVAADGAAELAAALAAADLPVWEIGEVVPGTGIVVFP